MIVCEKCGGNCDPGEIVQGVCLECMEESRLEITRREHTRKEISRLFNSPFIQMSFEEFRKR